MERLKTLAYICFAVLLTVNIVQTHRLAYKVNQIQTEQNNQYPTIELHLQQIDSSILKLNEVHPYIKGRK